MNKSDFLKQFIDCPGDVKIRMALIIPPFLQNNTIVITEEVVPLHNVLDFYVPKYEKFGEFDPRGFDEQVLDPEVHPLTIKQAMNEPAKWDLAIDSSSHPAINQLRPVPIATDLKSGNTLLLDSNHTITSLLGQVDAQTLDTIKLSVVHVTGLGLEGFIPDFKLLNRVRSQ